MTEQLAAHLLRLEHAMAQHVISPREAIQRAFEAGRLDGKLEGQLDGLDRGVAMAREVLSGGQK